MEKNNWSDWEKRSWDDLMKISSILATDDPKLFKNVFVAASNTNTPPPPCIDPWANQANPLRN